MNNETKMAKCVKLCIRSLKQKDESKHRKNNTDIYLYILNRPFPRCFATRKAAGSPQHK